MPKTEVLLYAEEDGTSPFVGWMDSLPQKVQDKCIVRIERLRDMGHELRRPEADLLRDGIHELRIRHQSINYRILYFFHEKQAIVSHGVMKEDVVPPREIDLAIKRKGNFARNPQKHIFSETES